jgi:uncharacterized membrane protein
MIFFIVLLLLTAAAWLAHALGVPRLQEPAARMRIALVAALLFFGTDHLLTPERYLPMVQGMVPWPQFIVAFTGVCELAGAVGLLVPRLRRLAGIMLAIYFIAVFPANIRNAIQGLSVAGLPEAQWYYWILLFFQPVAVWWALFSARVTPRPESRRRPQPSAGSVSAVAGKPVTQGGE